MGQKIGSVSCSLNWWIVIYYCIAIVYAFESTSIQTNLALLLDRNWGEFLKNQKDENKIEPNKKQTYVKTGKLNESEPLLS